VPEERIDADLRLGRHADVVGELKALVEFRDEQDAGSDATRREQEPGPRRRARSNLDEQRASCERHGRRLVGTTSRSAGRGFFLSTKQRPVNARLACRSLPLRT
jgi:hypothetical protein